MRVPLSWLKDFVEITIPLDDLVHRMIMAGLEVANIEHIGDTWQRDKLFVGEILEIKPHPNAERLVLAVVEYGQGMPQTVVTGNPAAIAHWRAILDPCVPCWRAAPMMTSSTSPGSTPARSKTARMTGATILGASRLLNEPRYDLVKPVRAVATITASFIVVLLQCDDQGTRSVTLTYYVG